MLGINGVEKFSISFDQNNSIINTKYHSIEIIFGDHGDHHETRSCRFMIGWNTLQIKTNFSTGNIIYNDFIVLFLKCFFYPKTFNGENCFVDADRNMHNFVS